MDPYVVFQIVCWVVAAIMWIVTIYEDWHNKNEEFNLWSVLLMLVVLFTVFTFPLINAICLLFAMIGSISWTVNKLNKELNQIRKG